MTEEFTHPNDAPEGHRWTLRNGWEFVLVETQPNGEIIGAFSDRSPNRPVGAWALGHWTGAGRYMGQADLDIIDAPREHTVWVAYYRGCTTGALATETFYEPIGVANIPSGFGGGDYDLIAFKQITITEGEGL